MQTQTMCSATQLSLPHRYEDVTGPTNGTTHSCLSPSYYYYYY